MNHYLLYTTEGTTIAPNPDVDVDNCQVLGRASGHTPQEAIGRLLRENPWIARAGFTPAAILAVKIQNN